jgi:hypothetical protein
MLKKHVAIHTVVTLFAVAGALRGEDQPGKAPAAIPTEAPKKDTETAKIIRIYESSKPKPIGAIPEGWTLAVIGERKIEHPPVQLPNGKVTTLSSLAYVLVPDKGRELIGDPFFIPASGSAQTRTIGASLTTFIEGQTKLQRNLTEIAENLRAQLKELEPKAQTAKAVAVNKGQAVKGQSSKAVPANKWQETPQSR